MTWPGSPSAASFPPFAPPAASCSSPAISYLSLDTSKKCPSLPRGSSDITYFSRESKDRPCFVPWSIIVVVLPPGVSIQGAPNEDQRFQVGVENIRIPVGLASPLLVSRSALPWSSLAHRPGCREEGIRGAYARDRNRLDLEDSGLLVPGVTSKV